MHRTFLKQLAAASAVVAFLGVLPTAMQAQIEVKANNLAEIKFGGRVNLQYNTTSVGDNRSSEFLLRRVRLTAEFKFNDFLSGKIEPEYAITSTRVRDAWGRLTFSPGFRFTFGQFKKPTDVFQLTTSSNLPVIERSGFVRGVDSCAGVGFCSFTVFSAGLLYSDRDIGVMVDGQLGILNYAFSATNGEGVFSKEDNGEKAFNGRLVVTAAKDLKIGAHAVQLDFANDSTGQVDYGTAYGADVDWGNYNQGLHVIAGFMGGTNWRNLDAQGNTSDFVTAQGIVSYKVPVGGKHISAIEPIGRVSWSDPDTDVTDDRAWLFTPGIQFFFLARNKMSFNADIYVPDQGDTEWSFKGQFWMYF
ncbi:MAG: hypothetical protein JSW51_07080 [Gemmatimonadota bacterium]|nr:MAG: hypothetical protein JSW51_07080 [Gemmatimonadota bacterium]